MPAALATTCPDPSGPRARRVAILSAAALSLAALALHLALANRYGFFRDELYFIACGRHLAWGYIDQPPLTALLAFLIQHLFGTSLFALRAWSALAGAATVAITGALAWEFGGRGYAVLLACLAALLAPGFLGVDSLFAMNALSPLFWMGCALILARLLRGADPREWLWLGALAGLGMENKWGIAFFGAGLVLGLLFTPARRVFATRWPWLGGALALALWAPNLAWEIHHHWITLVELNAIRHSANHLSLSLGQYLLQQILLLNPVFVVLWAAGLYWLFRQPRLRPLAWAYAATLLILVALAGKNYYLLPVYPMLLAAGGAFWEHRLRRPGALRALAAVCAAAGLALVPLVVPLLSVPAYFRYQQALGAKPVPTEANQIGLRLPQEFADQFGWRQMVAQTAAVYRGLPPAERAQTAILTANYGEAGAVDFFGPRYGLPAAISTSQAYYDWGPRGFHGRTWIVLGMSAAALRPDCGQLTVAARHFNPYGVDYENGPILLCRGARVSVAAAWPRLHPTW